MCALLPEELSLVPIACERRPRNITKEVTFEPVEGAIYERIDEAYRGKYYGSPYLSSMGEQPRSFRDSQDRPAREQCLTMLQ